MDGSIWDARTLWSRVHSRGGTIWEKNVKVGPRVEIYVPASGSNGSVWRCVDEAAMTAFLPSCPKRVGPFLSLQTSRGWTGSNNVKGQVFSNWAIFFFHWVSFTQWHEDKLKNNTGSKWHRHKHQSLVVPVLFSYVSRAQKRIANVRDFLSISFLQSVHKLRTGRQTGTNTAKDFFLTLWWALPKLFSGSLYHPLYTLTRTIQPQQTCEINTGGKYHEFILWLQNYSLVSSG